MTVENLRASLAGFSSDLEVFLTNGDLPNTPVISVTLQAADYGQMVLISR